ncbi:Autophagy protein 5 [Rhynchospora pubera]|uniref:Autophagy protein 5 n=1 Tax=Rhynchospora pubera TaxID=906938 RepID=A0AAV8BBA2_9POAL|nr:Autophagy protein 5 [Rhynchospora pubera]
MEEEATKYIWEGAIPLQIKLHESEITSFPPPPPLMILGLPLKWYIPTGVLFDLLCAEPERPWNLTVHFRGSPGDVLTPCEGEESVKWSYINSLKEAAYVINGNCKNVMNMSQADQYDLWQSLLKGNMEGYLKISSRLKLGPFGEDSLPSEASETVASSRPSRIPVRLYVRSVGEEIVDIEDAPIIDSWDKISYINRPFEIYKEEGGYVSLKQALKSLLPETFNTNSSQEESSTNVKDPNAPDFEDDNAKLRLVRVQGIEPDMDIPFFWLANCLRNPEFYLHICVFISKQPKLR